MRDKDLFQLALGLSSPWCVATTDFDAAAKRLDIRLDFKVGARFACPECKAADCPVHDTTEKTWRHLDFFQHQAFLTARTPRIDCPKCGVGLVTVPCRGPVPASRCCSRRSPRWSSRSPSRWGDGRPLTGGGPREADQPRQEPGRYLTGLPEQTHVSVLFATAP